ncbi:TetR/AcrR family transcriptional regulator [Exilibacterium tricleocarpae]|uniref:TetR/AcrR family transcriptional regulator n=1 Tax=Exilibacterium tricleocarpae TaxID=2591008 RepID=UPI0015D0F5E6|nr:TetR/AcrR family transcriptional regulator [Exilibacterium tricleocarpae]
MAQQFLYYKDILLAANNSVEGSENTARGNTKNTREDWLAEARKVLIEEGVDRVKIDRLAKNLKVTRGGFYWFFKNREDLLNSLLEDWMDSKNDPLSQAMQTAGDNPLDTIIQFCLNLIMEHSFSPSLDTAVRDWSRNSGNAKRAIDLVDNRRIEALADIFKKLKYPREEAFIRARILYFHQVGYYAMGLHETHEQRLKYLPLYFKQLTGFDLPRGALKGFGKEAR